jgi:hypothetical protein
MLKSTEEKKKKQSSQIMLPLNKKTHVSRLQNLLPEY